MADPTELASKARKTLADALQALQAGDDIPDELLDMAEPIAVSMGLLHKIEKGGAKDAALADEALKTVRESLDGLQNLAGQHPAVDDAMEAVAGSLSKLFALAKALRGVAKNKSVPPPAPKKGSRPPSKGKASRPPPPPKSKKPSFAPVNKTVPMADAAEVRQQIEQAQAEAKADAERQAREQAEAQARAEAQAQAQAEAQAAAQAQAQAEAQAQAQAAAQAQAQAEAQAAAQAQAAQAQAAQAAQAVPGPKERVPGMTDAPVPVGGAKEVSVELGAHSDSNFYKGLSGNDVIDHGGIFVATYSLPKIGDPIALKMLLPGDLEFPADAVVQWLRETRSGDAEPGFGAKFTRISDEGRQLIYRYAKNREPMFYDDDF